MFVRRLVLATLALCVLTPTLTLAQGRGGGAAGPHHAFKRVSAAANTGSATSATSSAVGAHRWPTWPRSGTTTSA